MPIVVANKVLPKGSFDESPADVITLEEENRFRRRILLTTDGGYDFMLSLDKAERLENGDGLLLEDGRIIQILASPEPLFEVRGTDLQHLTTLAWHLGNRHQPTQIFADHLRIRQDHVIGEMLVVLGATLTEIDAAFSPVDGAYAGKNPMHETAKPLEAPLEHAH